MKLKTLFLLFIILVLFGCEDILGPEESEKPSREPKFEVTNIVKKMKSYGCPYLIVTVKNTGNATGYNASCDVQAIKNNIIIDSGFAYFANGEDIPPGMGAQDEAIFFDLLSHNDYDKLRYDLDWLKR